MNSFVSKALLVASTFIVLLLCVIILHTSSPVSADNTLIAAYGLDETTGLTANDQSGNGNNGTLLNGAVFAPSGKYGGAITFDGVNDRVSIPDSNSLDLSTGMTLEAWVNPTQNASWNTALLKEQPGGLVYALYANTDTDRPSGEVSLTSTSGDSRGTSTIPVNTWTHLAATFDGTTLKLYRNGALESQKNLSGPIKVSTNPLSIGGNTIWGEYFQGKIDEIRVYTRALTAAEIQTDRDTPVGTGVPVTPTPTPSGVPDPRAVKGEWEPAMDWPIVAVHSTLLPTGKVLLWDGWEVESNTRIWNPSDNSFTAKVVHSGLFCSAHSFMADGKLLTGGGWESSNGDGIIDANIFDPTTEAWSNASDMHYKRWYPTTTELADGRVLALSGMVDSNSWANNPEIYNPTTDTWQVLSSINTSSMQDLEYPYIFKKSDGKMYVVSPYQGTMHNLDVAGSAWSSAGNGPIKFGSLVQYAPGKVLMSGGSSQYATASQPSSSVIDLTQASPAWRSVSPMANPRYMHNLVALPDGNVLAIGGARTADLGSNDGVLEAEMWNPSTETWSTLASMSEARNYHSVTMLMPDGKVLSAGGGRYGNAHDSLTAQIYNPPYLFKGSRPIISNAPTSVAYSNSFDVLTDQANSIDRVVLISLPTVTHTVDMNQHYLPVTFTKTAGKLTVSAPTNPNLAPPGYYMLFIVSDNGIPSVAKMVKLVPSGTSTPTPTPTPTTGPTPTPTIVVPTPTPTPTPIQSGEIVASYNFNEGSGTIINDRSGNNNQGVVSGTATWSTSGKNGKALSFNGTNNYVSINDANTLDLTNSMTLMAWIRPTALSSWRTVLLKAATNHIAYDLYANNPSNRPDFELNNGNAVSDLQGTSKIALNAWTHVASTFDGTTMKLYINGVLVSQRLAGTVAWATSGKLYIGGNTIWGEYFKGLIDDVRVYNKALSASEVQTDMNSPVN